MSRQTGFTLIELIMVIVILGILAATAIPRFVSLETDAANAAAEGMAGAVAAGTAINYAACSAGNATCINPIEAATDCADLAPLVQGGVNAPFSLTGGTVGDGCTITHADGDTPAPIQVILYP